MSVSVKDGSLGDAMPFDSEWAKHRDFTLELQELLNKHSRENNSDTPDHILVLYMLSCLNAYDSAVRQRDHWFGIDTSI